MRKARIDIDLRVILRMEREDHNLHFVFEDISTFESQDGRKRGGDKSPSPISLGAPQERSREASPGFAGR